RAYLSLSNLDHIPLVLYAIPSYFYHPQLHSYPTRRSSDLVSLGHFQRGFVDIAAAGRILVVENIRVEIFLPVAAVHINMIVGAADRKSTRLNSSHVSISCAVFCLKKKTRTELC